MCKLILCIYSILAKYFSFIFFSNVHISSTIDQYKWQGFVNRLLCWRKHDRTYIKWGNGATQKTNSLRHCPVFGVRGRFRGVKSLRVTFFSFARFGIMWGFFFPVWGHWLTLFVRKYFCICARCLSPRKRRIHAHKWIEPTQMQGWREQTATLRPIWRCQHTIMRL
jgi:hypothetical protein